MVPDSCLGRAGRLAMSARAQWSTLRVPWIDTASAEQLSHRDVRLVVDHTDGATVASAATVAVPAASDPLTIRKLIVHRTPSGSKTMLASPTPWGKAVRRSVEPKPSRDDWITAGPRRSFQIRRASCWDSSVQEISTLPAAFDSAPYFAALVASSWMRRAKDRLPSLASVTAGPLRTNCVMSKGPSAALIKVSIPTSSSSSARSF